MIIAVDPGKSGGIAFCRGVIVDQGPAVDAHAMPDTEQGLIDLLAPELPGSIIYVEQVGGFTGRGQPGSAMFTFGWWASGPVWIAQCYQARVVMITPQKWQKILGLGKSAGDKAEWKRKLKRKAQQLYPTLDVTLKTADALLILEAARLLEK